MAREMGMVTMMASTYTIDRQSHYEQQQQQTERYITHQYNERHWQWRHGGATSVGFACSPTLAVTYARETSGRSGYTKI